MKLALYCRNCTGKVYEEEIFEEKSKRYMQLGCLHCANKIYSPLQDWEKWKRDMEKAIIDKKVRQIKERQLLSPA